MPAIDLTEIEQILHRISSIPSSRNYWLIRTQGGSLYSSFREFNYVAIEHEEIPISVITKLKKNYGEDEKGLLAALKDSISKKLRDEEKVKAGLIAGQVLRFVYGVKKNDIVLIPSYSSETISVGVIQDTPLMEVTKTMINDTGCDYLKRKKVKWQHDITRDELDPYLYKMLQAHQAINNISSYGELIERSFNNFFIKDDVGNVVLEVQTTDDINAKKLFATGYFLLEYADKFFDFYNLPFSTDEIELKINLNSPGRIHLKAPKASTVWLVAVISVALIGGGLKVNVKGFNLDLSTNGLIQKVIDYQNNKHDRQVKDTLINNLDTMHVKAPMDALELLKQFSPNKNLPK